VTACYALEAYARHGLRLYHACSAESGANHDVIRACTTIPVTGDDPLYLGAIGSNLIIPLWSSHVFTKLIDAPGSMFVTVFYGVLDPTRGVLTYANAGHNPPLLMQPDDPPSVHTLGNTGVPLGIESEMTWSVREVVVPVGGQLLLYTDGVTEAQNRQQVLFAEWRLREVVLASREHTAQAMLAAVLDAVAVFTEGAPQSDDITIVALVHETNVGTKG